MRRKRLIYLLLLCVSATICFVKLHDGLQKRHRVIVQRQQIVKQEATDKVAAAKAARVAKHQTALNHVHLAQLKQAIGVRYEHDAAARFWLPALRQLTVRRSWAIVSSTISSRTHVQKACTGVLRAGGRWLRSVQVKGSGVSARCKR